MINYDETSRLLLNPTVRAAAISSLARISRAPLAFHERLPGYQSTPLVRAPDLARFLGVGEVFVKDESSRLGLPAFKILGASWAIYRALETRHGAMFSPWHDFDELVEQLRPLRPMTLATATDGNHGRAVAHVARLFGFAAHIYVPAGTAQARIDGIVSEGACVTVVDGTYDDAVARAALDACERCLVISDTSWPGYENVPRFVMEGYSTIFWEIEDELKSLGEQGPDLVAVQCGVGALAAAVVSHYRQSGRASSPALLCVEPIRAACMLDSMEAGAIVSVPGPHDSIMAGLNCGQPSIIAWPIVSRGIDAFIAISDERAREAMRVFAHAGVVAGETGAAGLAGVIELLTGPDHPRNRVSLQVNESSRVLLLNTEGATDPHAYETIVGNAKTR